MSGVIEMLGIGLVTLPTGIISSGFMNEISSTKEDNKSEKDDILYCPYCGRQIREHKNSHKHILISRSQDFYNELKTEFENCQLIKKRWSVIESALEAHKSRKYFLSVPALLTQVEGILTDIIVLQGEAKLIKGKLFAKDKNGNLKKDRKGKPIKLTGLGTRLLSMVIENLPVMVNEFLPTLIYLSSDFF